MTPLTITFCAGTLAACGGLGLVLLGAPVRAEAPGPERVHVSFSAPGDGLAIRTHESDGNGMGPMGERVFEVGFRLHRAVDGNDELLAGVPVDLYVDLALESGAGNLPRVNRRDPECDVRLVDLAYGLGGLELPCVVGVPGEVGAVYRKLLPAGCGADSTRARLAILVHQDAGRHPEGVEELVLRIVAVRAASETQTEFRPLATRNRLSCTIEDL